MHWALAAQGVGSMRFIGPSETRDCANRARGPAAVPRGAACRAAPAGLARQAGPNPAASGHGLARSVAARPKLAASGEGWYAGVRGATAFSREGAMMPENKTILVVDDDQELSDGLR